MNIYEEKRRNSVEAYCYTQLLTPTERCIQLEDLLESQAAEIAHLKAALECRYGLEDQIAELRQTMTLAYYWVKEYSDDSENATHTKRVLLNALNATPEPADGLTADAEEDRDG